MDLELITIGDELLLGFTVDTNAAHIARELAAMGVSIVRRATVGDTAADIVACVRDALDRTGAVITTGGLGPTADDLTRPAIAELFGRELVPDETRWEALRALWRERGRGEIPQSNRAQIMIPRGATVLENRHGTAPGLWLEDDRRRWCAMLPGVPREMRGMLGDEIIPRLTARLGGTGRRVVRSRTVRTTGIAESSIAELLGPHAANLNGLSLAYLPGQEGVDLRVTARDLEEADADAVLAAAAKELRSHAERYAYADGAVDLASVVLDLCAERSLHIAVAESCTGGLLGARLTAIAGSSAVVLGGVIAYSNPVKERLLGVASDTLARHGAVSEEVAIEMAAGARAATGAEIGISVTGVAGPRGGTPEKPVGLVWIAVNVSGQVRTLGSQFIGDRAEIRFRATQAALDLVRRMVTG
ncbi:MAG TPA: competence/damage-inducible protein A [Gemmatimonadaceae bacterium]|nr:competence/damage-inducible protein A [Gemmatimonadaceae bacterium]